MDVRRGIGGVARHPEPPGLGESAVGDGRRTSSGLSGLPGAAQRCPGTVQGGLRYTAKVDLNEVRLLASLLTWKATLARPPYGGGNRGRHLRETVPPATSNRSPRRGWSPGQPRPGRLPGYPLRGVSKSLKEVSTLAAEDTLSASDIVNGFDCPVVEVFE
jgi:hypothetical protein